MGWPHPCSSEKRKYPAINRGVFCFNGNHHAPALCPPTSDIRLQKIYPPYSTARMVALSLAAAIRWGVVDR